MEHLDEGRIHAWLDGALPDADAAAVRVHVAACGECAAAVAEARGLIAASSRIISALDDVRGDVIPRALPGNVGSPGDREEVTPIQHAAARNATRAARPWWRQRTIAAAALLFVAAGSVMVTKTSSVDEVTMSIDSAASAPSGGPSAAPSPENSSAPFTVRDGAAQDMVASSAAPVATQSSAAGGAVRESVREQAVARRIAGDLDASTRETAKREVSMSAPGSSPAAVAPPAATSPVIAAAPPVAPAPGAGAAAGGSVGGAAGLAGAAAKTASIPAGAPAFQGLERLAAAPAQPRAPGDAAERRALVLPLLGCYALSDAPADSARERRVRAESRAANVVPARVRLSDTVARAGSEWYVARPLDTSPAGVTLQWRPLTRDVVQLRMVVAADTTVSALRVGDLGARVRC